MKKYLLISCVSLLFSVAPINAQSLPDYWSNLKTGQYAVGFKSFCVFDTSRKYDFTFGDSTIVIKDKNLGRPILINVWYPAVKNTDTSVLKVKDFFNFPANENTSLFFEKLKEFQLKNSKQYAIEDNMRKKDILEEGDTSLKGRDGKRAKAFDEYISAKTISHKNAIAAEGEFPLVIYHQGLGGTMDENSLLIEYLASNGFIVINSAFQMNDASWTVGTGDPLATFGDMNFIINYCKKNNISKSQKVFLMGHSFGANSSISFLGEGHQNVNAIIPLDSDFGYVLYSFYPSKYNPFVKEKLRYYNIPIFCVGRSEAHFRMMDSISLSKRHYLTIDGMLHDDFTSQGAIGRYFCIPYIKEKEEYKKIHKNYLDMCAAILQFLNAYSTTEKGLTKNDIHLNDGWKFEICKPDEKLPFNSRFVQSKNNCPTISQWLDIINHEGLKTGEKIYTQCSDTVLKNDETLTDILDALYHDADLDTVKQYLNWMKETNVLEKNIRDVFMIVTDMSLRDIGAGYTYDRAGKIYHWLIENYPDNAYGYMGMILVSGKTEPENRENYVKKFLAVDPNYHNRKGNSFWEDAIVEGVDALLKKETK